jgi:hypothetical protein
VLLHHGLHLRRLHDVDVPFHQVAAASKLASYQSLSPPIIRIGKL